MSGSFSRKLVKAMVKARFKVLAPTAFALTEVGEVFASSPDKLIKRTLWVNFFTLTGDISQQHIKLLFQIDKVEDGKAYTIFKGHDLTRDYLRSLIRRGCSKIDGIFDVLTKDGFLLRVTIMAITQKRVKSSQEKAIRKIMREVVEQKSAKLNFDEFVREMILGKVASEAFNTAKKICPLRRVEVRKSKLLLKGEGK
ncbi:MAG: 30S ribosomal protein S3ae [Candidatus Nezhaarchaeales archaeon]